MAQAVFIECLHSGAVAVRLTGELDLVSVPALTEYLDVAATIARDLVVNLRDVTFVDASVIGALIQAHHNAVARGGSLVLSEANPWVERVLRAARATDVLRLLPSEWPGSDQRGRRQDGFLAST